MERSTRVRRSRSFTCRARFAPYHHRSQNLHNDKETNPILVRTASLALEKRDWEDAKCSVCMEFPHNAVLLLCSSHDKGCRPYMCGTSYRHSNCLDQFKKAYTKVQEVMELASCPLCRGQVKGWTVVEPARKYLDNKKRSCMQDDCSFKGTYKDLRKHVKAAHPSAKPREVDPTLEQRWRRLEHDREHEDVMSTIRSSMPRSVVFGDYVIDMGNSDLDDSEADEMVGDESGVGEFEGRNNDIGRSILYFFLREGSRFMRLDRDSQEIASENLEVTYDDDGSGGWGVSGDDDGYIGNPLESEGRRRRRRRSRGRSVVDLS